jgi:hypothetical protein
VRHHNPRYQVSWEGFEVGWYLVLITYNDGIYGQAVLGGETDATFQARPTPLMDLLSVSVPPDT